MSKINVIEMFKSIQGEGNEVGKITTFLRLGGCSFRCGFCDSKQTWEPGKHGRMIEVDDLVNELEQYKTKHVTITGGNPAIWKEPMLELVLKLKEMRYTIAMETQGDIFQPWMSVIDNMVISPKNIENLPITIEQYKENIQKIIDRRGSKTTIIKTPIFNKDDLNWFKDFVQFDGNYKIYLSVGNDWTDMTDTAKFRELILARYKWLIEEVLQDQWFVDRQTCVIPQVHVLVWDNKAGV